MFWKSNSTENKTNSLFNFPWYSHKVYARYWRHYDSAMRWMHRHQKAYRRAMESLYCLPWHPWHPAAASPGELPPLLPQLSACKSERKEQEPQARERATGNPNFKMARTCWPQGSISRSSVLKTYFPFWAQIDMEYNNLLGRQQQLEAEDPYVEADQDLHWRVERSVEPPTERPGERRMAEMKKLYGAEAAKIQAMEAAMQLIFDRNCDRKQPKYWPIIPLKL
uniref:Gem nuclear organelle associated protein 8 n=1 Tax=Junco hyemalis TaxID=40217 RepID=A0A8C5IVZ7_JUNHY